MPVILSVGYIKDLLSRRNNLLREHGFQVIPATNPVEALSQGRSAAVDIVVFGHGVPTDERNAMAGALRSVHPAIQIVFLYRERAQDTELADAILNVTGSPADLIETLRYLMEKRVALGKAGPRRGTAVRAN